MKWSELISENRIGGEIVIDKFTESKYPRSEFEKDYRRIISCASFRRLQDKTQVFPLDQSDFVRTRLTHSYEVAMFAKTLGTMLLSVIREKDDAADEGVIRQIPEVLACAGLLHDIGNPPFGHFGEEIIKKWFSTNLKSYSVRQDDHEEETPLGEILTPLHHSDLLHFDGNAQALRVLTKLHFQDGDCGLNLTNAVLNTLVKYPSSSVEVRGKDSPDYCILNKKMGYFDDDRPFFEMITNDTGANGNRHPLALILEAADDIAYKTADIEDGFKKGLFTLNELLQFFEDRIEYYMEERSFTEHSRPIRYVRMLFETLREFRQEGREGIYQKEVGNPDLYAVQNWIPHVQEWLMYCAIFRFDRDYENIMDGVYHEDLFYDTHHEISAAIIYDIMKKFIFPNRSIVKLELAANTILSNLLDKFTRAALYHDGKYVSEKCVETEAYKKLYRLISDNYRAAYELSLKRFKQENWDGRSEAEYDIYLRILLVIDYISGMTDSYAKSLYQELNGIYGLSGIY